MVGTLVTAMSVMLIKTVPLCKRSEGFPAPLYIRVMMLSSGMNDSFRSQKLEISAFGQAETYPVERGYLDPVSWLRSLLLYNLKVDQGESPEWGQTRPTNPPGQGCGCSLTQEVKL